MLIPFNTGLIGKLLLLDDFYLEAVIDECINNHFHFIRFSGKWLNSSNEPVTNI